MKKMFYVVMAIIVLLSLSVPVSATEEESGAQEAISPLAQMEMTLPEGVERQSLSETGQSFQRDGKTVGGILLFGCDRSVFEDVLHFTDHLTPLVMQALEDVHASPLTWQMEESSVYGFMLYNFGTETTQYAAYLLRGNSTNYLIWFDRGQISSETEKAIMESVYSPDIADELNKVSSEAYMTAIGKEIDSGDMEFVVELPDGLTQTSVTDGALFHQMERAIGGYKVVHFEKGILPEAEKNQALILGQLQNDLRDQIDLSEFDGEITAQGLITAEFAKDGSAYTVYILSYGQVGTQYVIWLDTAALDQAAADSIVQGAQIVGK